MSTEPTTLLSLPSELTTKIVAAVLTTRDPVILYSPLPTFWMMTRNPRSSQLLRVCRRLYSEGISILYGLNSFLHPTVPPITSPRYANGYQFSVKLRHLIRDLSIDYISPSFLEFADYRNLRKVTFRLMAGVRRAREGDEELWKDKYVKRILKMVGDPPFEGAEVWIEFKEAGIIKGQVSTRSRRVRARRWVNDGVDDESEEAPRIEICA